METQQHTPPLTGRIALVTGAGRGLGRAIADRLAEAGAVVHGTSRTADGAREIAERYGTAPRVLDVASAASVSECLAGIEADGVAVDLLVNNAGINIPAPAVDVTADDWDQVFGTNVRGAFLVTTALARAWIARGVAASVVNVASQAGIVAIEERAAYGASKAALLHLTKTLALEWAPHGIRVNAIAPTFVRTELTASTLARGDWADELLGRIPLGRFGEPADVAESVVFLSGAGAAMVTGHTLVIDGGYTIR